MTTDEPIKYKYNKEQVLQSIENVIGAYWHEEQKHYKQMLWGEGREERSRRLHPYRDLCVLQAFLNKERACCGKE